MDGFVLLGIIGVVVFFLGPIGFRRARTQPAGSGCWSVRSRGSTPILRAHPQAPRHGRIWESRRMSAAPPQAR